MSLKLIEQINGLKADSTKGDWDLRESNPPRLNKMSIVSYPEDGAEDWDELKYVADCPPEDKTGEQWVKDALFITAIQSAWPSIYAYVMKLNTALNDVLDGDRWWDLLGEGFNEERAKEIFAIVGLSTEDPLG